MTSFVNLLGDEPWSDADITRRTESLLRRDWPEIEEQILNRDFTAAMAGMAPMTPDLQGRAMAFKVAAEAARQAGADARADLVLRDAAIAVEIAQARLSVDPAPDDAQDLAQRAAAQAVVDAASPIALALVARRAADRGAP